MVVVVWQKSVSSKLTMVGFDSGRGWGERGEGGEGTKPNQENHKSLQLE